MRLRRLAPLLTVFSIGCFTDTVSGNGSQDGGSSSDGSDTSAGAGPATADSGGDCASGASCIAAPEGWMGPVLLHQGGCTAANPEPLISVFAGLTWDPALCSCDCGSPRADRCEVTVQPVASGTSCDDPIGVPTALASGACVEMDLGGGVGTLEEVSVTTMISDEGACDPVAASPQLPAPQWEAQYDLCATTFEPCGEGLCVPREADVGLGLCVWTPAEVVCPPGFEQRIASFMGIAEDSRGCGECTCTDPPEAECAGVFSIFGDPRCESGGEFLPVSGAAECFPLNTPLNAAHAGYEATLAGTCTASGGAPTGAVTPAAPVTICCV